MKRTASPLRITAAMAVLALGLTACGDSGAGDGNGDGNDGPYKIGISQLTSHPALDATAEGFQEAFDEAGIEVEFDLQNAQGEVATANSIANTFAGDGDVDLVASIATPAAQAAATAVKDKPVVFMAVTDAVGAGIVEDEEKPGGNVTGQSDRNPVKEQLQLLLDVKDDVETVGIVWNSGESNSKVQVEQAKEAGEELGLEIKEATITNSSEVQQGVESLKGVDGIYVPTDNAVVSALESVIAFGEANQVPVVSADTDSVERGALGTYGIDYEEHGRQAGEMAVRILKDGQNPGDIPVGFAAEDSLELVLNQEAAGKYGVELPQELVDRADEVVGD